MWGGDEMTTLEITQRLGASARAPRNIAWQLRLLQGKGLVKKRGEEGRHHIYQITEVGLRHLADAEPRGTEA